MAQPDYFRVTFRVRGLEAEAKSISRLLECEPSDDPNAAGWHYSLDKEWEDLNRAINTILDELTSDLKQWQRLATEFEGVPEIFIGVFSSHMNFGVHLKQETLKRIGERQIELDFDVYSYS